MPSLMTIKLVTGPLYWNVLAQFSDTDFVKSDTLGKTVPTT